jgi:hypothetical protein
MRYIIAFVIACVTSPALADEPTYEELQAARQACLTHRKFNVVEKNGRKVPEFTGYEAGFEGCPQIEEFLTRVDRNKGLGAVGSVLQKIQQ